MQAQERDKLISELRETIAFAIQLKKETEQELKMILGIYYDEIVDGQIEMQSNPEHKFLNSTPLQN